MEDIKEYKIGAKLFWIALMSSFNHKLCFKSTLSLMLSYIQNHFNSKDLNNVLSFGGCLFTFLVAQQTNIHVSYLSVHTVALLHLLGIQMFSSLVFQLWDVRTYVTDAFSFLLKMKNLKLRHKQFYSILTHHA